MISETLSRKVDARSRFDLADGVITGKLEAFIRTAAPMTPDQEREITKAGVLPHSIRGTIVAGAIADAAQLEGIAELPFVRKIELSRPMSDDSSR